MSKYGHLVGLVSKMFGAGIQNFGKLCRHISSKNKMNQLVLQNLGYSELKITFVLICPSNDVSQGKSGLLHVLKKFIEVLDICCAYKIPHKM